MVQLYRYPGLTASKAKTLLRKVCVCACSCAVHGGSRRLAMLLPYIAGAGWGDLQCWALVCSLQAQEKASSNIVGIDGELVSFALQQLGTRRPCHSAVYAP